MNIYLKTSVIILSALLALLASVYWSAKYIVLDSFMRLESQQMERNLGRVDEALKSELGLMHTMVADWSRWDDSYQYMQSFSTEYQESNLVISTYKTLNVTAITYLDSDFKVQKHFGFDFASETFRSYPASFLATISKYHRQRADKEPFSGLIEVDGTIYMIASDNIVRSDLSGPPRGRLVMMREFNQVVTTHLAEQTLLNVDFVTPEFLKISTHFDQLPAKSSNKKHSVAVTGENKVTGISQVDDINGELLRIVKVDSPRTVFRQGIATLNSFTNMLALAGLSFAIIVLWTLRRVILSRLLRLSQNLIQISNDDQVGRLVEVDGNDEIAQVAKASNQMLAGLARFYLQRQHDHEKQRRQNDLLINLAKENCIVAGELQRSAQKITDAMQSGCNLDRASVWLFSDDMNHLNCVDLLQKNTLLHSEGLSLPSNLVRHTMRELAISRLLKIENTSHSKEASALLELLNPTITNGSILFLSISFNGHLHGFIAAENFQTGHQYQLSEETFLFSITDFIEQTLVAQERKYMEKELWRLASFDNLTKIPNRSYFLGSLSEAIVQAKEKGKSMALLFIDLDNFKPVNDNYGHAAGDLVLTLVAKRIRKIVRDEDIVARLGGDEFTVLLNKIQQPNDALIVAEKLVKILSKQFSVEEHQLQIGCSIGISIFPLHADNSDELISLADDAMYQAKQQGRNQCVIFKTASNKDSESH